jgi:hypothetical protein
MTSFPSSLPPERQYQIVDMKREDMDMLEWLVRYLIPIPKRYYWEHPPQTISSYTANENNIIINNKSNDTVNALPNYIYVWHIIIRLFEICIQWLDQISQPWIQPTTSRFEYVRSTMTPHQLERCQQQRAVLSRKRQQRNTSKDSK